MLTKIEKVLVLALVFLFPTQLALHFWPSWAFIYGIRVDYLAPAIYLTDILVVALLVFGVKEILKYKKYLIWLVVFSAVNIIFSTSPVISLFKWFKIFEFVSLSIYFAKRVGKSDWENIYIALLLSLILFSLIGVDQFLIGHTIGGAFYLLGERSFTLSTPGIALSSVFGHQVLRAYSTFPHPNALAGYLGASTVFLFVNGFFKNNRKRVLGLLIIISCFFLTFSLTAFLGVVVIFLLRKHSSKLFALIVIASLLLPIISTNLQSNIHFNKNVSERLDLAVISGKIISQHFWDGSGLNTFTIAMTNIKPAVTTSWLLQPVHNIFLLMLSEVGIFGLLLLTFYFSRMLKFLPLVFMFVLLTGFFDHYWLDSQQNLLLLSLVSATLTSRWKKQV